MKKIILPVLPNSALQKIDDVTIEGWFSLRSHKRTGFIENSLFDETKIKYNDAYQNDQSNSPIFLAHMNSVYQILKGNFSKGSLLVEVGCGKGRFLEIVKNDEYFNYRGFDTAYEGDDAKIEKHYLSEMDKIDADVVVFRHTLEHIRRPHLFLSLLSKIFPPTARIFIEVPQFDWIEENQVLFDFSYEHVNYFNSESLSSFFDSVILNGNLFEGQYQFVLASLSSINLSLWNDYRTDDAWVDFDFSNYFEKFKKVIESFKDSKRLWIWGGGTKGVLFLKHLCDCDEDVFKTVVGVVDVNPKKQNHFTPSTLIKIDSPESFFEESLNGDTVVVVNPNYFSEVKEMINNTTDKSINVFSL